MRGSMSRVHSRTDFGDGDGNDTVSGGTAGGWTDTIQLQGVNGDYTQGDWTLTLTTGSVQSQGDNALTLTEDAAGTITTSDGSILTFDSVEQIQW